MFQKTTGKDDWKRQQDDWTTGRLDDKKCILTDMKNYVCMDVLLCF
jgi:hypothetical protein